MAQTTDVSTWCSGDLYKQDTRGTDKTTSNSLWVLRRLLNLRALKQHTAKPKELEPVTEPPRDCAVSGGLPIEALQYE